LILFAAWGCSVCPEGTMLYTTDPQQAEINGATVYVNVARELEGWTVTALFGRRPPTAPIDGEAVEMELVDASGITMPMLDHPRGPIAEAGGSLSTTANAVFRFGGPEPPSEIVVRWEGGSARFRVRLQL
jgi:hypothetical protein